MISAEEYFKKEYGEGHIKRAIELNDLQSIYALMEEFADNTMQVKNNDLLHDVGVREFECDDVVCTNDGKMWVITEIDGDDVLVTGNGKKDYPLEKSDITHAH